MKFLALRSGERRPVRPVPVRHPERGAEHQVLAKVDYRLNDSQSIFGRHLYAVYENPAFYDGKNVLTLSQIGQKNVVHSFVAGHRWVRTVEMAERAPRRA